jgi:peptidoglycan hydrolase FlgJ
MIDAATLSVLRNERNEPSAASAMSYAKGPAKLPRPAMDAAQTEKVAKDFEAFFISSMMESMFGDSVGESMFGESETAEVYKTLMMEQYGKTITNAGGIGIADYVKQELLKQQEM